MADVQLTDTLVTVKFFGYRERMEKEVCYLKLHLIIIYYYVVIVLYGKIKIKNVIRPRTF